MKSWVLASCPKNPVCETSPAFTRSLPCLNRLQKGLRQSLACSFVGNHEEALHSTDFIQAIKHLCDKATSAVLFNSSIGDWFQIMFGVLQGYPLSPTLLNIFLERIMTDALKYHEGTVSIGGRTITNGRHNYYLAKWEWDMVDGVLPKILLIKAVNWHSGRKT